MSIVTWTTYQGSRVLRVEGREVKCGRVPQIDLEVHHPPGEDGHIPRVNEVDVGGAFSVHEADLKGTPRNESQDLARAGVGVRFVHPARRHLEAYIRDALRSADASAIASLTCSTLKMHSVTLGWAGNAPALLKVPVKDLYSGFQIRTETGFRLKGSYGDGLDLKSLHVF